MASTVLPNGIIIPEKFSRDWYNDLYHNWQELDNLLGGGTPKDGTLTIQKNGDTVGTFSANQATDETVNIEVPDVNNGTLTINGTTVDSFSANSSSDKTVNIQCVDLTSNQTVGGDKEFTGTTTAHDVIPSATDTYNLGSPSYQWNNAYIKSLTINGVACGDILTHNASEFVGVSGNQTISGVKTFSSNITIQGSYNGNEFSTNARTVLEFRANRDTANKSGIYLSKFRQNRAQGEMGYNDSHMLAIDVLENEVRTNDLFRFSFKGWVNDVPTNAYLEPYNSNTQTFLGTASHKWADVGTNAINGINPGALSLPSISASGANAWIALDTTDWVKNAATSAAQKYTPPADGWLNIRVDNAIMLGLAITGGSNNYMHQMVRSETPNSLALLIPVFKNIEVAILVAGNDNLTYNRATFYPCQGNV